MASGTGSHSTRISPRKFSEKIALLNKKERDTNAEFEQIIKEVQKTRSKQSNSAAHPPSNHELEQTANRDFQAAHADSLEEIERVYENLIKSVGQCEDQEEVELKKTHQSALKTKDPMLRSDTKSTILSRGNNTTTSISPANNNIPTTVYYSQSNEYYQPTNIDLNDCQPYKAQRINMNYCKPLPKNIFSGHSTSNINASSSMYSPQTQRDNSSIEAQPDTTVRTRVVSFGSASRHNYLCTNDYQVNRQTSYTREQGFPYQLSQNQNQYLKEPFVDRSRLKSSSDPQLHVAPIAHTIPSVNTYKTDKISRQDSQFGSNPQPESECCNYQHRSHNSACETSCCAMEGNILDTSTSQDLGCQVARRQIPPSSSMECQQNQGTTATQLPRERYNLCDAAVSRSELPGIKICAIEDENSFSGISMGEDNPRETQDLEHSSRDSSLPDISNLQFNGSTNASPERTMYQDQWSLVNSYNKMNQENITVRNGLNDSCVALDGSWISHDCSRIDIVDMDTQADQIQSGLNQSERARQDNWLYDTSQLSGAKISNALSNSDCGFDTVSNHQHGSLTACNSSDLFNNIIRSRSHNSIDYLAKQGNSKRPQIYTDNLSQCEQHHTSQYCLQNGQPAAMNVRRISELKAPGTSTSPLNSSSNLNSPQSDMNSPGSSTTEQYESATMYSIQDQSEFCPESSSLAGGSNSTLVADSSQQLQCISTMGQDILQSHQASPFGLATECNDITWIPSSRTNSS